MPLAALLAGLLLLACSAAVASADGDPASDVLYTQPVFLPQGTPPAQQTVLRRTIAAAARAGYPIKVAVIGSTYDLGSITPLWGRPGTYARFLGAELSQRYHSLLLIVMPAGLGVYDGGRPVARERRELDSLRIGAGTDGLVATAGAAVRTLAAAAGHPLPAMAPRVTAGPARSQGIGVWTWLALVAGLGAMAAAWIISLRLRPPTRSLGSPLRWPGRLVRASPTGAAVAGSAMLAAAVAVAVLAYRPELGARPAAALPAARDISGFTWPAGRRTAPRFTLRDQRGRTVAIGGPHRGVTILAFLDPVCRNLCPAEASVLGQVARRFPVASMPPIVAVSVDPWGNAAPTLERDIRNWQVGPSFRWAVGPRAELTRIWHAYEVGVRAKTVRVAGTRVHEISHDEQIYLIDASGDERVVYPWPFTAAAVARSVRGLESGRS